MKNLPFQIRITSIDVSGSPVADDTLISLLTIYPGLEKLNICKCTALSDKALLHITQHNTSLTVLKIDGCSFSAKAFSKISNLIQLRKLHMADCKILEKKISELLKELRNLKKLKVSNPSLTLQIQQRKSYAADLRII